MTENTSGGELFVAASTALAETDVDAKLNQTHELAAAWESGSLQRKTCAVLPAASVGRPCKPERVHPRNMPRRGLGSGHGRIRMMHAVAHIEFNAVNLALDAVHRFQFMTDDYYSDWLHVADEEAKHFAMIRDWLRQQGSDYGAFDAHDGLWEMAEKTADDVLERMALIPRVLEARGLDVTPGIIDKLTQAGQMDMVAILQVIYEEEIGHVKIGNHWFRHVCAERGLEAEATFFKLLKKHFPDGLHGPFNLDARREAGFSPHELALLNAK
ncbi:MAG: ferritin-like domain-containing protein [Mariprofundaceae bacterium]